MDDRAIVDLTGMRTGYQPVDPLADDFEIPQRYQYAVANLGMFKSVDRMEALLAHAGSLRWNSSPRWIKSSNW